MRVDSAQEHDEHNSPKKSRQLIPQNPHRSRHVQLVEYASGSEDSAQTPTERVVTPRDTLGAFARATKAGRMSHPGPFPFESVPNGSEAPFKTVVEPKRPFHIMYRDVVPEFVKTHPKLEPILTLLACMYADPNRAAERLFFDKTMELFSVECRGSVFARDREHPLWYPPCIHRLFHREYRGMSSSVFGRGEYDEFCTAHDLRPYHGHLLSLGEF